MRRDGIAHGAERRRVRMPLSVVIVRYFVYVLASLAGIWLAALLGFSLTLNAGFIYPANYGAAHMQQQVDTIAASGALDARLLPTPYRFAVFDSKGVQTQGNLAVEEQKIARNQVRRFVAQGSSAGTVAGEGGYTVGCAPLSQDEVAVLVSDFLPQFVDRDLAARLPNPQNIWLAITFLLSVGCIALFAHRASAVLTQKMSPLLAIAGAVAEQNLDVAVGTSNVAQIDDVLAAMGRMRESLKASLEKQWAAEARQREQIAMLAHDMKTPLTVIRGNADLLQEDVQAGALSGDQAVCVSSICKAAMAADAYVAQIIETSRDGASTDKDVTPACMSAEELVRKVERASYELARANGRELVVCPDEALHEAIGALSVHADAAAWVRAVGNAVANACTYAPKGPVTLRVRASCVPSDGAQGWLHIAVEDEGPGFTDAMLAHAQERFWRGDDARSGAAAGEHWGLGLASAGDIARACGGALKLANKKSGVGAQCVFSVPLYS